MLTTEEIAYTDAEATRIRYRSPPPEIGPTGRIGEDHEGWTRLVDWFRGEGIDWHDAALVYISRRFGVSIPDAYAATDGWAKSQFARIELEIDPDAIVSFN